MNDTIEVAVGGRCDRHDRCAACGQPMLFRIQDNVMFCQFVLCHEWLQDVPIMRGAGDGQE